MLKAISLWWHGWSTRRKMDRVFSRRQDPYGYRESPYELARLAAMEAALGGRRYRRTLEVGCAEGAFTERLKAMSEQVLAVDISKVALARARAKLAASSTVSFIEADIRRWEPGPAETFDAVVLADVLYYIDKPFVQEEFDRVLLRVKSWLKSGGRLLLAHGFAGEAQRPIREGYRERFTRLGLELLSESVVGEGEKEGKVCCLLSLLGKT